MDLIKPLIALLATSTNRLYLPVISTLIERGDLEQLLKIRRGRARLIGDGCVEVLDASDLGRHDGTTGGCKVLATRQP